MTAVRTLYARCVCAVRAPCAHREHAAATACAPKKRRDKGLGSITINFCPANMELLFLQRALKYYYGYKI